MRIIKVGLGLVVIVGTVYAITNIHKFKKLTPKAKLKKTIDLADKGLVALSKKL